MEAAPPSSGLDQTSCAQSAMTCAYAVQALTAQEDAAAEAHIAACPACQGELASVGRSVDRFAFWPTDMLRPPRSLQTRLARRIAGDAEPVMPPARAGFGPPWVEPGWEDVAPGIACKLLATDGKRHRVSMLVRLAPGASYPAHIHAGHEELHLLDGDLSIDGRRLSPGDYSSGVPGVAERDVRSAAGCTCLLTTSTRDILC